MVVRAVVGAARTRRLLQPQVEDVAALLLVGDERVVVGLAGRPLETTVRCSVFIATSLDGFIARPDGALDWLPGADVVADDFDGTPPGDSGYDEFMAAVDVIVMGRATYDTVLDFGIAWPYPRPVVVLTSRPLDTVPEGADVRRDQGPVADVVGRLEQDGFTHAYVDGGDVIQQFLAADLIDAMTITIVPVLLGQGIRLFGDLPADRAFRADPPRLAGGLVQTTWPRQR